MPRKRPTLELYAALSFFQKKPCEILIFFDGAAEIGTVDEINYSKERYGLNSHISLSLNVILQSIFRDEDLQPIYDTWVDLNENEMKIIEEIQSKKYDSLSIAFKESNIAKLTGERGYNSNTQLHNLQREAANQDLQVKIRDGQIRHIKQIIIGE